MISLICSRSPLTRKIFAYKSVENCVKRLQSTTTPSDQSTSGETKTSSSYSESYSDEFKASGFQSQTNSTNTSASSKPVSDYYDIVICGGGMVGSAMAYALETLYINNNKKGKDNAFKHLKIALIESAPKKDDFQLGEYHSNRVCALNDNTIKLFKSLGNFNFIENARYGKVKYMHVWDGSSDSHITFNSEDDSNLALIVENDLIQHSLTRDLASFDNLKVFHSNQINDFDPQIQVVNLKLKDGSSINAKLLIGSDGANSFIRKKAQFGVTQWNYDQVAIVATLKLAESIRNETAWQRFLSTGPIALLPLNDHYSSLVWSIKKPLAKQLLDLNQHDFAEEVNKAFVKEDFKNVFATKLDENLQNAIDNVKDSSFLPNELKNLITSSTAEAHQLPPRVESCAPNTRASYPLTFLHSNNYVQHRIALIGDAVHRVHPLAGQGVNLGFGDVTALTSVLKENILNGAEIGTHSYLKKYESIRQTDAFVKCVGIDMLNRLYTDYNYPLKTPLVALRSIGLTLSNRITPLKNFYINRAMK